MKYNNVMKQAYNDWKRRDRTPNWAKIIKKHKVYDQKYYEVLSNLQSTLNFLDSKYDKSELEYLGRYLLSVGEIGQNYLEKRPKGFYGGLFYFGGYQVLDKTGYGKYWTIQEINYSKLAEKMLGITEKNKIKCLGGSRWVVWKKL